MTPGQIPVTFTVNGEPRSVRVEARRSLAEVLREELRLTGTHLSCEVGTCGTCTVLLDGEPMRSCLLLGVQADGRSVTTVEGLGDPGRLSALQEAFWEEDAAQCGFCTPGMLMLASWYLSTHSDLSDGAVRRSLSANLCRCTGYEDIVRAVIRAGRADRDVADR